MRLLIEVIVVLYLLMLTGQAERDGVREGLDSCEASHGKF
jgi:hypothetical protein